MVESADPIMEVNEGSEYDLLTHVTEVIVHISSAAFMINDVSLESNLIPFYLQITLSFLIRAGRVSA